MLSLAWTPGVRNHAALSHPNRGRHEQLWDFDTNSHPLQPGVRSMSRLHPDRRPRLHEYQTARRPHLVCRHIPSRRHPRKYLLLPDQRDSRYRTHCGGRSALHVPTRGLASASQTVECLSTVLASGGSVDRCMCHRPGNAGRRTHTSLGRKHRYHGVQQPARLCFSVMKYRSHTLPGEIAPTFLPVIVTYQKSSN